jgi:hypothetical protein
MAHEVQNWAIPGLAASNINAGMPVTIAGLVNGGSGAGFYQATSTKQVIGVARASAAQGKAVEVAVDGIVKCRAAASLGAGAVVGPVSGVATDAVGPLASGFPAVGVAVDSAAAGDIFSVLLRQQQFVL